MTTMKSQKFDLNEFLINTRSYFEFELFNSREVFRYQKARPWIVCRDDFTLSVQAGELSYSIPRENEPDRYSAVEVGYPSREEELLMPYEDSWIDKESKKLVTSQIYAYVPVEVVEQIVEKHGGYVGTLF